MKTCPECGGSGNVPTNEIKTLYGFPVLEMQERGWIRVDDPTCEDEVFGALLGFMRCRDKDELLALKSCRPRFRPDLPTTV